MSSSAFTTAHYTTLQLGALPALADDPRAESVAVWGFEVDPLTGREALPSWTDDDVDGFMEEYALNVRTGIEALENHRHIRNLRLDYSFLNGASIANSSIIAREETNYWRWRRRPGNGALARDVERLFQGVLPNHRTLESFEFVDCFHVPSPVVSTLVRALLLPPNKRRTGLHFRGSPLGEASCRALAEALRQNLWIERLTLVRCQLSRNHCRQICDAVADNRHVRTLTLREADATPFHKGALRKLLHSPNASLKELDIGATTSWESTQGDDDESNDDELARLVGLLRTNVGLEGLTVRNVTRPSHCGTVRDLVHTYHFSLRSLVLSDAPAHEQRLVDSLLEGNRRVRRCWNRIQTADAPHLVQPKVLPETVSRIGRFPTLIFRFLREPGNAAILSGLVEQGPSAAGLLRRSLRRGKRNRSRPERYEPC
jgi:hypothetical protein